MIVAVISNKAIGAQVKELFFDRAAVINDVDKTARRALAGFGGLTRTISRRSIRKRKTISAPGKPPTSQTGLLKRFIFFSFDPQSRSVVIGPAALQRVEGGGDGPSLLEFGGKRTSGQRGKQVFRPRPFMGPAFDKAQEKLPDIWQKSAIR